VWAHFLSCFIHFGVGCFGLLSQKKKKEKRKSGVFWKEKP
jgi:hypothetical protein